MSEYTKNGGQWLGAARNWVKWNCRNGSHVTWGSGDVLEPQLTIRQVEELAARVADAAASEMDYVKQRLDDTRRKRLRSEIEMMYRIEALEEACTDALVAIATLPEDSLGYGQDGDTRWPLRDELRDKLRKAAGLERTPTETPGGE